VPPGPQAGDESIAAFVTRRMGREAYERLFEPLMSGIFAGDGERISVAATFPNLRHLERLHGSVMRGLLCARATATGPPFLSLRDGMHDLVASAARHLTGTTIATGSGVLSLRRATRGAAYELRLADDSALAADAVVLATPAYASAWILASLDPALSESLAEIPYTSTAIVTLAYAAADLSRPLDGYGYVVPRVADSDVLACTWTSSKWQGRAPQGHALVRVYMGRFGRRDLTTEPDTDLVALARGEIATTLGPCGEPLFARIHRWPRGIPQYEIGALERIASIERRLSEHPGLALAGAAYRGVGIPDCIASGERAAERVAAAERWELAS